MILQDKIIAILDQPVFDGQLYYIQAPPADGSAGSVGNLFGAFSIVGGTSYQSLEGDLPVSKVRVQISVFAANSAALIATVKAVNDAMAAAAVLAQTEDLATTNTALFNFSASVPVDGYEPETGRFYSHMDFYCWDNQ